jgi:hypothetical protein
MVVPTFSGTQQQRGGGLDVRRAPPGFALISRAAPGSCGQKDCCGRGDAEACRSAVRVRQRDCLPAAGDDPVPADPAEQRELPALAICMLALGILERNGVWIVAGHITALVSVTLVWGVLYALSR